MSSFTPPTLSLKRRMIAAISASTSMSGRSLSSQRQAARCASCVNASRGKAQARKSGGKGQSVAVRVELGGRRIIQKQQNSTQAANNHHRDHTGISLRRDRDRAKTDNQLED